MQTCQSWDIPPGWSCLVLIKGVSRPCRDGHRSSLEPLVSTTLRDLFGTWVVGFNVGVDEALVEAISALSGKKKIMRI